MFVFYFFIFILLDDDSIRHFIQCLHFQIAAANDATPPLLEDQFSPFCTLRIVPESHKSRAWVQSESCSRPSTRILHQKIRPSMDTWLRWLHSKSAHVKRLKNMDRETSSSHEILGCDCLLLHLHHWSYWSCYWSCYCSYWSCYWSYWSYCTFWWLTDLIWFDSLHVNRIQNKNSI